MYHSSCTWTGNIITHLVRYSNESVHNDAWQWRKVIKHYRDPWRISGPFEPVLRLNHEQSIGVIASYIKNPRYLCNDRIWMSTLSETSRRTGNVGRLETSAGGHGRTLCKKNPCYLSVRSIQTFSHVPWPSISECLRRDASIYRLHGSSLRPISLFASIDGGCTVSIPFNFLSTDLVGRSRARGHRLAKSNLFRSPTC